MTFLNDIVEPSAAVLLAGLLAAVDPVPPPDGPTGLTRAAIHAGAAEIATNGDPWLAPNQLIEYVQRHHPGALPRFRIDRLAAADSRAGSRAGGDAADTVGDLVLARG